MPDRINTPFTNEHFAAFCLSMLGQPYWYGTDSEIARRACARARRASTRRTTVPAARPRYRQDIANKKVCADCMGGAKGYAWTSGGQGVLEAMATTRHSRRNPVPTAARTSPRTVCSHGQSRRAWTGEPLIRCRTSSGLAVRFDGHVGSRSAAVMLWNGAALPMAA